MQLQHTPVVEKLNHLTAILNDSSEGYLTAAAHARSKDLENFFEKLSYQRKDFARQIRRIIRNMGAHTASADGFLSLLHRTWKDMTYQLKSRDKDAVKTCCVIGEKFTSNYYESILVEENIPEPVKEVLTQQLQSIHSSLHQFQLAKNGEVAATITTPSAETTLTAHAERKMIHLIAYLNQVSKDFEMIADDLEDKTLKHTFMGLSEENKQFAVDLHCYAKNLGVTFTDEELPLFMKDDFWQSQPEGRSNELLHICDNNEYLFLKLYTDALKEFLNVAKLKDMMIFQYNSIRTGFVKLRMLNSLRFQSDMAY
ncbi:MAG: PA2169 family four-helix-bundle protein [Chitinophagaceae bacterium]|nr:MAG: PA2169 family four-helix-bundle protein [Chitinophagaceae bacterium]